MKKSIIYILAMSALSLTFSCTRIEENFTEPSQKVKMTFTAIMTDDAQTKTAVDGTAGDAVRNLLWLPEDEISVIAKGGDGTVEYFHNNTQEKSAKASFSGEAALSESYYALFPYQSSVTVTDSVLRFKLPASQKYAIESFGPKAMPMVAKVESGSELYFMNVCGGFIVNLTGTEKIKSIQFTGYDEAGNKAKVSGDFTVNMNYKEVPEILTTGNGNTNVTLNCGDGVQLSEETSTSFHIALPPATYHGFSLVITTSEGKRMLKESDRQLTITRANLTNAASFAFEENFFGFDLSAKGTANSYIISAEGFYHFDASVIGNGDFGLIPKITHTENTAISPESAELLWEDTEGIISGVSYEGGEISFTASGAEGNALIVAKDENDEIIWSWHIWATDEPQEHLYVNNLGNFTVLDRNLGAIRSDRGSSEDEWLESVGLVYQLGRKDPFYVNKNRDTWYDKYNTQFTLEESIKMPSAFPYGYEYWDNQSRAETYWQASSKTIYDPCPAGYKVATDEIWAGFTVDGNYANRLEDMMVATVYDHGWYFYYDEINTAWYPASKYISSWGDSHCITTEGILWKSGTNNGNTIRYYYSDNTWECGFDRLWMNRSQAYPVRCMKDENLETIIVKTTEVTDITSGSAAVKGAVSTYGDIEIVESGFVYGTNASVTIETGSIVTTGTEAGEITATLAGLTELTKYYVRAYVTTDEGTTYSNALSFITPNADGLVNLSVGGTSNSYMVYPVQGTYTFDLVKGNSTESVGTAASVEVLWETLNTLDAVSVGDVIESVELTGTQVKFTVPEDAVAGNALIGVKNSAGKILWSWHIWVVDMDAESQGVIYPSGAMFMDRNLGALTNDINDVRSYGFFYQWGRKDPFVGSGDANGTFATTTLGEKTYIESGSDTNTQAYATSHPTTVISNSDWNRTSTLWGLEKTVNDPCPPGWRVPHIDDWSNFTSMASYMQQYPRAGYTKGTGTVSNISSSFYHWSCYGENDYSAGYFYSDGHTGTRSQTYYEYNVRCVKDASFSVTTGTMTDITENTATVSGEVTVNDGTSIDEIGALIARNDSDPKFGEEEVTVVKGTGTTGSFTLQLHNLKPNATYYVRVYAKGGYNTRIGEVINFSTKASGNGEGFDDGGDYEWE